jgi:RNA polymerase sigma-70 factor (ECF subfamily)
MHTTQVSLLQRLRQPGDQEAWGRFVELYTPLLYHWARHAGLQEHDAVDLVQDVLTTLVQKMPGLVYDPQRSFRAWLRAVTLNRWRDTCKMRSRRPATVDGAALANVEGPNDLDAFWEAEYRNHLIGRALAALRQDLQPRTWQACWAFVVEGRPAAEVAAELGMSESSVYVAKSRVLRRLRRELEGLLE